MNRRVFHLLFLVGVALLAACGGKDAPTSGTTATSAAALQSGGIVPIPCAGSGNPKWGGTAVDLIVADAMVACSGQSDDNGWTVRREGAGSTHDPYLIYVRGLMADAETGVGLNWQLQANGELPTWKTLRDDHSKNCDPNTLVSDATVDATLKPRFIPFGFTISPLPYPTPIQFMERANVQLRTPAFQLCIAQTIRELIPGSSAAATLLLSEADQRSLLETVRERAQISMLAAAANGVAFSSFAPVAEAHWPENPQPSTHYLPFLQGWALLCGNDPACVEDKLESLGRDFAAAVQLHSMVSEELAYLLARSRSARTERGGDADTRAEEVWGSGSWHQRLLAAMMGGDPLANANLDPWQRPHLDKLAERNVLFDKPGSWSSSRWYWADSETLGHDWPGRRQTPYVAVDISEPQVRMLFNLAKAFDRVQLAYGSSSCEIDYTQSGEDLYTWVEAEIRTQACYQQVAGECSDAVEPPDAVFPEEDYLLWERYRIHPSHAETLARYLGENLNLYEIGLDCPGSSPNPDHRAGAQYLSGRVIDEPHPTDSDLRWLHVTKEPPPSSPAQPPAVVPEVAFFDRPLADIAPAYSRNALQRFPSPWELAPWALAAPQGYTGTCPLDGSAPYCIELSLDSMRVMGAMSAMAATRMMLMSSIAMLKTGYAAWPEAARLNDYFAHAEDILRVIDGAIGADSVALRPQIRQETSATGEEILAVEESGYRYKWLVDISYPASGDSFWDRSDAAVHRLCAIPHPAAGNLAMSPASILLGDSIGVLMAQAESNHRCADGVYWEDQDGALHESYEGAPKGWTAVGLSLPRISATDPTSTVFTLVVERTVAGSDAPPRYFLAGSSVAFGFTGYEASGQYLAYGGSLGTRLSRAIQGRVDNPTAHRYDGFDLPSDWVPPFTAELIGGSPGESSVDRYLTLAKASSAEATAAVADAIDMMLAEEADDAAMAAATVRSQEGIKEEQQKLCGSANPECDVELVRTTPSWKWFFDGYPHVADCSFSEGLSPLEQQCEIDRLVYEISVPVLGMEMAIAEPVLEALDEPVAPAFSEFGGGALQGAFIEQWRAIRALRDEYDKLRSTAEAVKGRIELAVAIIEDDAYWTVEKDCDPNRLKESIEAGISTSCKRVAWGRLECEFPGDPSTCSLVDTDTLYCKDQQGQSYTNGPYLAQQRACLDAIHALTDPMPSSEEAVVTAYLDAVAATASAVGQVSEAQARVQQASAQIASLLLGTELAKSRYELERNLAAIQQTTSFGLYRRYRSYDLWRAKAMVDNARMYALAARRAIEARYVVDLSTLTQSEAFVQSPSTWADEVYGYDLSLPAAVGLSVGTAAEDGIYPNKVRDYVGNLESFVMGYAANRPAAVASKEIEVVNLKGLKRGEPVALPFGEGSVYADMGEWMLHCPETATTPASWVPAPRDRPASETCVSDPLLDLPTYGYPDRARMEFMLDPWGRLNDHIANEPYTRRFNGRWDLMAVNFAGTGIKDCDQAPDPYACYSEGFIRYSLSHVGPAWVTDYDGIWRTLNVPIGRIEGAKGLASELWLDPLKDGWNTSYMSAVSRTELQLRPLGGAYDLEFVITPEIDIDRIERVQLLIGSTYWVKQD